MIEGQLNCPCCGLPPDKEIIADLHMVDWALSKFYGAKIITNVNSGYRCRSHHRAVYLALGYKEEDIPWGSYHLKGEAVDAFFSFADDGKIIEPIIVACIIDNHLNYLKLTHLGGIGLMTNSLHLDRRLKHKHWIRKADMKYHYDIYFDVLREDKRKGVDIYAA